MMKRTRTAALLAGALCLTLSDNAWGFTASGPVSFSSRTSPSRGPLDYSSPVRTTKTSRKLRLAATKSSGLHQNQEGRLGPDEEHELLRQAVELRRLTTLEKEMALASPTKSLPLLSVRAKAGGYGEELTDYEDAIYQGQVARETLVTRNMGLVHYTVSQILGSNKGTGRLNSLSREDLVQEGAIGLARAVDKWNPAIGGRFSTYAVYWIRAAVFRCIAERDDVVRVPEYMSRSITQINKAAKRLGMDIDDESSSLTSSWKMAQQAKELAEEAGLTDKQLAEAMKIRSRRYSGGYVPFDSWMQQGKDLISDVPTISALEGQEEDPSYKLGQDHLRATLSKFLRPKEVEALLWRYGLVEDHTTSSAESFSAATSDPKNIKMKDASMTTSLSWTMPPTKGKWGEAMAFTEVAKRMEVSAEYTRRLCNQALEKLKNAAEEGRLEPALLSF
jgi:RNA polymerase sigma factor (sigma-70 family)